MNSKILNNRKGDKKLSLILTLKALETSIESNPINQTVIARMVSMYGEKIGQELYCDRKTIGRHLKVLKTAGYNIISVGGKGVYLKKVCKNMLTQMNNANETPIDNSDLNLIQSFKPDKVKLLIVVDEEIARGNFYLENTALFRYVQSAFSFSNIAFSLDYFKELGGWVYYVCDTPLGDFFDIERTAKIEQRIHLLLQTIKESKPEQIVVVENDDTIKQLILTKVAEMRYVENKNITFQTFVTKINRSMKEELSNILISLFRKYRKNPQIDESQIIEIANNFYDKIDLWINRDMPCNYKIIKPTIDEILQSYNSPKIFIFKDAEPINNEYVIHDEHLKEGHYACSYELVKEKEDNDTWHVALVVKFVCLTSTVYEFKQTFRSKYSSEPYNNDEFNLLKKEMVKHYKNYYKNKE